MKKFMPDVSPQERLRLLRENCDSHETTPYYKDLTDEELDGKKEQFFINADKLGDMEEDMAEVKKTFKLKGDPIKEENKKLRTEIRTRKQLVNGTLFNLAHHDDKMMLTYDENGDLVSSRRLRPDETQGRLFVADRNNIKEGTNN